MYWPALLAAGCDFVAMILFALMSRLIAGDRGWTAGVVSILSYYFAITTTTVSVTVLQHHNPGRIVQVMVALALSTIVGTKVGQELGKRLTKDDQK